MTQIVLPQPTPHPFPPPTVFILLLHTAARTLYQDLSLPNKRLPVLSFETGKPTGKYYELPDSVFSTPLRTDIIHRNIVWQEKNARTTLYKGKKRSEVRGGGRKPYKQKGTGRSRQGSIRSPLWVGGGMAHPPKLKSWGTRLQKKVRRLGMRVALAAKYRDLRLVVVSSLALPLPKTRAGSHALLHHGVSPGKRVLLVDTLAPSPKSPFALATRNIPGCKTLPALAANVRDIVLADRLFITVEGLDAVIERVTKED